MVLLFLVSCSHPKVRGPYNLQKPAEGKAIIYLYRLETPIDSLNPDIPLFYINNKKQGKLIIGRHYMENVDAGKTEISYKESLFGIRFPWKSNKLIFEAQANQIYYVRFSIESVMRITRLQLVPTSTAQSEITSTKEIYTE